MKKNNQNQMNSARIFDGIRSSYLKNRAMNDLGLLIEIYNKASPQIFVRISFLTEINLNGKTEKIVGIKGGVLKGLSLESEGYLKFNLLIFVKNKKITLVYKIKLENMIQIMPVRTAPNDDPQKGELLWEDKIMKDEK